MSAFFVLFISTTLFTPDVPPLVILKWDIFAPVSFFVNGGIFSKGIGRLSCDLSLNFKAL